MAFPKIQGRKRTKQGPNEQITVLCEDNDQMSGFKEPERGKTLIFIHDYAQNVRVQRTRQGRWIILSYDYSLISGFEFQKAQKS